MITVDTSSIVTPDETTPPLPPAIEKMLRSPLKEVPDFSNSLMNLDVQLRDFYEKNVCKSTDHSVEVFARTPKQAKCDFWHDKRYWCIPSSKAWEIFKAQKVATRLSYWTDKPRDNRYFRHGHRFEPFALKKLSTLLPNEVITEEVEFFSAGTFQRAFKITYARHYKPRLV